MLIEDEIAERHGLDKNTCDGFTVIRDMKKLIELIKDLRAGGTFVTLPPPVSFPVPMNVSSSHSARHKE